MKALICHHVGKCRLDCALFSDNAISNAGKTVRRKEGTATFKELPPYRLTGYIINRGFDAASFFYEIPLVHKFYYFGLMASREINIETWKRKETYLFFRSFDSPFFNITANVEVTHTYNFAKQNNYLFFLLCLYASSKAANNIEEFRYRIQGDKIICHDEVSPGCTILLDDETFRYGYFRFQNDLPEFHRLGIETIRELKSNPVFEPNSEKDDTIYYTVIPWVSFTAFEHAKMLNGTDSIPRIGFGKYSWHGDKLMMPVSVQVNHALMDALHVGKYFERFQEALNRF